VFLGNDVLLNEVIYIFFIIIIKFVISGRDVTAFVLSDQPARLGEFSRTHQLSRMPN